MIDKVFLNGPRDHVSQTLDINPHELLFWHLFLTDDFLPNKLKLLGYRPLQMGSVPTV